MPEKFPRSPYDTVAGELPKAYHPHLGRDFDGRCLNFLHVKYDALQERVRVGGTDEEILEWCYKNGRRPSEEEVETWSDFMCKRGWRDAASDRIIFRLKEAGIEHRDKEAVTMFDFIDLDEGRTPPDFKAWEPPRLARWAAPGSFGS